MYWEKRKKRKKKKLGKKKVPNLGLGPWDLGYRIKPRSSNTGSTSRWSPDPHPNDLWIHVPMSFGSTSWSVGSRPSYRPLDRRRRSKACRRAEVHTDAHDCCCRRSSSRRKCGLVGNSFSVGTVRLPIIGIDRQVDRHKKTSKKNLEVLLNKSRRRRRRSLEELLVQGIWILVNNG